MQIFDEYTLKLLRLLNSLKVEYIVIGGYAVNFYGYRRTTGDIDLWIKPENGINKEKIIAVFKQLNIAEDALLELTNLDFSQPLVFCDGEEPFKIDFITQISGVNFEEAWSKRVITIIEDTEIPFIHFNHLVLSKMTTNRERDKNDIEQLQRIQALKKSKDC